VRVGILAPPWFPVPPPATAGSSGSSRLLADGLVDGGHEVTLFASGDSRTKAELRRRVSRGREQSSSDASALRLGIHGGELRLRPRVAGRDSVTSCPPSTSPSASSETTTRSRRSPAAAPGTTAARGCRPHAFLHPGRARPRASRPTSGRTPAAVRAAPGPHQEGRLERCDGPRALRRGSGERPRGACRQQGPDVPAAHRPGAAPGRRVGDRSPSRAVAGLAERLGQLIVEVTGPRSASCDDTVCLRQRAARASP